MAEQHSQSPIKRVRDALNSTISSIKASVTSPRAGRAHAEGLPEQQEPLSPQGGALGQLQQPQQHGITQSK